MRVQNFWKQEYRSNTVQYRIDKALLSDYLEGKGYKRLNNFGETKVIKLQKNVAYIKTSMDVYNDVLDYIKKEKNNQLRSCFIEQGELLLLSKKAILGSLPLLKLSRYTDVKNEVCLFYKNGIVKVREEKITFHSYSKLKKMNKFIFYSSIIQREFNLQVKGRSDFKRFLKLVTNNTYDYNCFLSTIGYLVSSYKNPSLTKAIIISDFFSQIKNDAFGRSGKGIIIQALSKVVDIVEYNGKITDLTNDKFVFQNVGINTRIVVLQDVVRDFKFESLFSVLTDSMSIERKYSTKINIPFKNSPKIVITSNYTIEENSDSYRDRKHLLLLNNFFNADNKPEQHLRKLLFNWNNEEYQRFDKFISNCVQVFLNEGLLKFNNKGLKDAKLKFQTSSEFVDLIDNYLKSSIKKFKSKMILDEISIKGNSNIEKAKIISKWLQIYSNTKGYELEKTKSNGVTIFKLKKIIKNTSTKSTINVGKVD